MDLTRTYWSEWSESLHRWGLGHLAAWLIEAAGPLNIVGAQILYISQPLASPEMGDHLKALANLLEEEDEARAFAALLKG